MQFAVEAGVESELETDNWTELQAVTKEAASMLAELSIQAAQKVKQVVVAEDPAEAISCSDFNGMLPAAGLNPVQHLSLYRSATDCHAAANSYFSTHGPMQAFGGHHGPKCLAFVCSYVCDHYQFYHRVKPGKTKWPSAAEWSKLVWGTNTSADIRHKYVVQCASHCLYAMLHDTPIPNHINNLIGQVHGTSSVPTDAI